MGPRYVEKNIVHIKSGCDPVVQLKALVKIHVIDYISNSESYNLPLSPLSPYKSSHLMLYVLDTWTAKAFLGSFLPALLCSSQSPPHTPSHIYREWSIPHLPVGMDL